MDQTRCGETLTKNVEINVRVAFSQFGAVSSVERHPGTVASVIVHLDLDVHTHTVHTKCK